MGLTPEVPPRGAPDDFTAHQGCVSSGEATWCKARSYRAGSKLTAKARKAGQEANARIAAERAAIAELQAAGATSLRAIAAGLNARGILTAGGIGPWSATQVLRTLARC
jgi:hypothetical protein